MDKDISVEAKKQYLRYFRIWFIVIGIMAVIFAVLSVPKLLGKGGGVRQNGSAPAERVYDYADVLTDSEEQNLRDYIAQCETKHGIDLVLVTMNEDVESYGYWDSVMRDTADDFYDNNNYGYNKIHGDGALLLDNWYEDDNGSQKGSWLSTCGIVKNKLDDYDIDVVLDKVYREVEDNPYEAYKAYVTEVCKMVSSGTTIISWWLVILLPIVVAIIFALVNLRRPQAENTKTATAYVAGGGPVMKHTGDTFLRKDVVKRRIQTSSGGSSGGGGSHRSSSGVSHGGGGRRR